MRYHVSVNYLIICKSLILDTLRRSRMLVQIDLKSLSADSADNVYRFQMHFALTKAGSNYRSASSPPARLEFIERYYQLGIA